MAKGDKGKKPKYAIGAVPEQDWSNLSYGAGQTEQPAATRTGAYSLGGDVTPNTAYNPTDKPLFIPKEYMGPVMGAAPKTGDADTEDTGLFGAVSGFADDFLMPDDLGGIIRGTSEQWIGPPPGYKETLGAVYGAGMSLGESAMNSLYWGAMQGARSAAWGISALPGGMRTVDMEWTGPNPLTNTGGISGEAEDISLGMVSQIDAAMRASRAAEEGKDQNVAQRLGFGGDIVTQVGDALAAVFNPLGTGQAVNTQIYTDLGDPLDVTNEDLAAIILPEGIDADLRDKVFAFGANPQAVGAGVTDLVAQFVFDPTLYLTGGLSALRYGVKGTKWAGATNRRLQTAEDVAAWGASIDEGLISGKATGASVDVTFLAKNHLNDQVLLEHPWVKGADAAENVRWMNRAGGDLYVTAAVMKARAGLVEGWESLRALAPSLFDDMASARGMRTMPESGEVLNDAQRLHGEAIIDDATKPIVPKEDPLAPRVDGSPLPKEDPLAPRVEMTPEQQVQTPISIDEASAGQTLERGGARSAKASEWANAWRQGRAETKWNTPVKETVQHSSGWVVDVFKATSKSRPVQVIRWAGDAKPQGIVHLKGADNASSHVEVRAWLKHSDLSPEQRTLSFSEYMTATTAPGRKAALEAMEKRQVAIVARRNNLTDEQALAAYTGYASKRALFSAQFSGKKGFAVAEDQSLVTAPGIYSELDESFAMLNTRVFDRAVSKHSSILKGVESATEFADALNSYWKLSVLMRIGYPLRNVTEGLLRSVAVAGVVMTHPDAILAIPSQLVLAAAGKTVARRIVVQGEALLKAQDNLRLARASVMDARKEMRIDELGGLADLYEGARMEVAAAKELLAMAHESREVLAAVFPKFTKGAAPTSVMIPSPVKPWKLPEHKLMKAAEKELDDALETAASLEFRSMGGSNEFERITAGEYRNGAHRIDRSTDGKTWNLLDGDSGALLQTYGTLAQAKVGSVGFRESRKSIVALERQLGKSYREAAVKATALQKARNARDVAARKQSAADLREWKERQSIVDKAYVARVRSNKASDIDAVKKMDTALQTRTNNVVAAHHRLLDAELKSAKAYDKFAVIEEKVRAGAPGLADLTAAERKIIVGLDKQAQTIKETSASYARVIEARYGNKIGYGGQQIGSNGPVVNSAFEGTEGEIASKISGADQSMSATYMNGFETKRTALLNSRDYMVLDPTTMNGTEIVNYWDEMVNRWNRSYRMDSMVQLWLNSPTDAAARANAKAFLKSVAGNEYRANMNGVQRGARGEGKGSWELNDGKGHPINENVDEYVDLIFAEFSREVPLSVRSTLAKRPMMPEEAAAAFGSQTPPSIAGRASLPKADFEGVWNWTRNKVDQGTAGVMKFIGTIPETNLLRHPFYAKQYENAQKQMYKLAMDQGTDILNRNVQQRISVAAHKRALRSTRDTMYTIEHISNSASLVRWAMPFFPAWENSIKTWSRIVYQNPTVAVIGQKVWNLPATFGLVFDKDGNRVDRTNMLKDNGDVVMMPDWFVKVVSKIPLQPFVPVDEDGNPIGNAVRMAGFNVISQGGEFWLPGVGGFAPIPIALVMKGRPELVEILRENLSESVYWSTFPGDPNASIAEQLMSTGAKRVTQMIGDDPDTTFARLRVKMARDAYIAAQIEGVPFGAREAAKADRRATDFWKHSTAQAWIGFTASTAYVSPYAAQERIWAAIRDDQTMAFDDKILAFHKKVGSDDFDAITRSTSESKYGVDSNQKAWNRLTENKSFVENLADKYSPDMVGMFTNLGNTRERHSGAVYSELFDFEVDGASAKDRMSVEQYRITQDQRDGTNFYYSEMAKLDQAAVDLGYTDASKVDSQGMHDLEDQVMKDTLALYPAWSKKAYTDQLPERVRAAREIYDEIGAELGKTGVFMKDYLDSRDNMAEAFRTKPEGYTDEQWKVFKDSVKVVMADHVTEMKMQDIGFSDWYERWMEDDDFRKVD